MMAVPSSIKKEDADNPASFVSFMKDYPILLEKSMRDKRNKAIEESQLKIEEKIGVFMDSNKILKKFNNMKTRVKVKADTNKTGNKKIVLKPWEEELLQFIEGDLETSIVRLKGAVTAGTDDSRIFYDSDDNTELVLDSTLLNLPRTSSAVEIQTKKPYSATDERNAEISTKKIEKKAKLSESGDTKNLSLPELQSMVLLKQLEYFKKVEELVDIKLKREKAKEQGQEAQQTFQLDLPGQNVPFSVLSGNETDNYLLQNL